MGERERELVEVVREAEKRQEMIILEGNDMDFGEEGDYPFLKLPSIELVQISVDLVV